MKKYYIISLKHTNKRDFFITLWRSENSGYCQSKKYAGVYTEAEIRPDYHDYGDDSMIVECEVLDDLMIKYKWDGVESMFVPNYGAVWKALNIEFKRSDLVRRKPKKTSRMSKETKDLTLWNMFQYGAFINREFMSTRLLNLLRTHFEKEVMQTTTLADMLETDLWKLRRVGAKTAKEFWLKREEFIKEKGFRSQTTHRFH